MERVVTSGGRVGHIVDSVLASSDGRIVTTVCGKTHPEFEVRVDNDVDYCATCEKKVFGSDEPEPEPVKEPEPKKASAPTKAVTKETSSDKEDK